MCLPKVQETIQQGEDEDGVYEAVQRLMQQRQNVQKPGSVNNNVYNGNGWGGNRMSGNWSGNMGW